MQERKFSPRIKLEEWVRTPIIRFRRTIDDPLRFGSISAYLGLTPSMQVSINSPGLSVGLYSLPLRLGEALTLRRATACAVGTFGAVCIVYHSCRPGRAKEPG